MVKVRGRVLLTIGDEADVPLAKRAKPVRYPAMDIAAAVGLDPQELPGTALVGHAGWDDRLSDWHRP